MILNSLARLKTSGSTGRVVNLASVFENHGETADYAGHPMFINPKLNRALILKHTLRAYERDLVTDDRLTVTKVILPFQPTELGLGGYSFFVSEPGFDRNLATRIGAHFGCAEFARDLKVLRILDALPAFDPFLLRERLKRFSILVSRCYFDFTEADATRLRSHMLKEISKIETMATGGVAAHWQVNASITEKLLSDETAESLEPLRHALGLTGEAFREAVFAWKGFLYYGWKLNEMLDFVPGLQKQILNMRILRASPDEVRRLNAIRRRIGRCMVFLSNRVRTGVDDYQTSYQNLVDGDPGPFRRFLKTSPARFLEVGDALGMLMHIKMYWDFKFPNRYEDKIDVEDANSIFQDFNLHISGIATLTGEAPEEALAGCRVPAAGHAASHELGL